MKVMIHDPIRRRFSQRDISPKIGKKSAIKRISSDNSHQHRKSHSSQLAKIAYPFDNNQKSYNIQQHSRKKYQQKNYAEDLRKQIAFNLKQKQTESEKCEKWNFRKELEMKNDKPYGKPGCGAPLRNKNGNIVSNYHALRHFTNDRIFHSNLKTNKFSFDNISEMESEVGVQPKPFFEHSLKSSVVFTDLETKNGITAHLISNNFRGGRMSRNNNINVYQSPRNFRFSSVLQEMHCPESRKDTQLRIQMKQNFRNILLQQMQDIKQRKLNEKHKIIELEYKAEKEHEKYLQAKGIMHSMMAQSPSKTRVDMLPKQRPIVSYIPRNLNLFQKQQNINHMRVKHKNATVDEKRTSIFPNISALKHSPSIKSKSKVTNSDFVRKLILPEIQKTKKNVHEEYIQYSNHHRSNIQQLSLQPKRNIHQFFNNLLEKSNEQWQMPSMIALEKMTDSRVENRNMNKTNNKNFNADDFNLNQSLYPSHSMFVSTSDRDCEDDEINDLEVLLRSFINH